MGGMERHATHDKRWCWLLWALAAWSSGCAGVRPGGSLAFRHYEWEEPRSEVRAQVARQEEPRAREPAVEAREAGGERERVLAVARGLVGQSQVRLGGRTWPNDCTGFVEAVLAQVGVSLRSHGRQGDNGVTAFYRHAQARGRVYAQGAPQPGDLVFFRETYDRNRDGRRNDGLTHVGLVESVEADGTVTVIHRVQRGVVRYRMNLKRRDEHRDQRSGAVLNDMLRVRGRDPGPVLTGQLFASYASVLPEGGDQAVVRR